MNQYFVSIERELFQSAYADIFEAASLDDAIEYVHELLGEDDPDSCAYLTQHDTITGVCINTFSIRP